VNPADQPILYLVLSSPVLKLSQVDEYAETTLGQRISMISGVAQAGGPHNAVFVVWVVGKRFPLSYSDVDSTIPGR
jgi:multidrug efflux pump subunit AcrB